MGRGVSCGGGQSSLGYLFGANETKESPLKKNVNLQTSSNSSPSSNEKAGSSGVPGHLKNNYLRPESQNCGNFITDRPSTKVHAAPGGGSSLGYLFGGEGN